MKRLLIFINLIASLLVLHAQNITLEECTQLATDNYPAIKQYGLIERAAQYTIENTRTSYLPQISFSTQATYQNAVSEFPDAMKQLYTKMGVEMKGLNKDQYKIGLDINQNIWDGGLTHTQNAITKAESEIEKQQIKVELYSIRERITALYFGILLLEAQSKQNISLQELLQNNCEKIAAMIKNNIALESDWNAMKAELISTKQQYTQISSLEQSYRQMLGLFIHKDLSNTTLISPEERTIRTLMIKRPELDLFDTQQAQLNARRSLIYSSIKPQIGAFAQGFYGNPGYNLFKDMMENKWTLNYMIGIRLKWNFSHLYTKKRELENINIARQRIETQKETFLFNTSLTSVEEQNAIDNMRNILNEDDEIIRLRISVRKASENKLSNGIINVNDLLRDITSENQSKIAKAAHQVDLLNKIYKLKNTINQ